MPNRMKQKGSRFEYDFKHVLEMLSFYAIRAYSSTGVADLVFTPPWNPCGNYRSLLVQCKDTKKKDYIEPFERNHLSYLQQTNSALVIIAFKDNSKVKIKYWESKKIVTIEEFLRDEYGIPIESYSAILKAFHEYKRPIHMYPVDKEIYIGRDGKPKEKPVSSFADFYSVNVYFPHVSELYRKNHESNK